MSKNQSIDVQGTVGSMYSRNEMDFISLTNMLTAKDGDFFISDWLRNRNTVEFLGIWEKVHNPNFNYGEYATIRNQAGLNSCKISGFSNVSQLVCLANLENLNTHFIQEGLSQSERLQKLNQIAIQQMALLLENRAGKWLGETPDEK